MTAPRLDFGYLREPPSARVADRLLRCGKYLLFGFCMMLLAHRPGVWEWFPDYLEWALQLCLYSGAGLSAWPMLPTLVTAWWRSRCFSLSLG